MLISSSVILCSESSLDLSIHSPPDSRTAIRSEDAHGCIYMCVCLSGSKNNREMAGVPLPVGCLVIESDSSNLRHERGTEERRILRWALSGLILISLFCALFPPPLPQVIRREFKDKGGKATRPYSSAVGPLVSRAADAIENRKNPKVTTAFSKCLKIWNDNNLLEHKYLEDALAKFPPASQTKSDSSNDNKKKRKGSHDSDGASNNNNENNGVHEKRGHKTSSSNKKEGRAGDAHHGNSTSDDGHQWKKEKEKMLLRFRDDSAKVQAKLGRIVETSPPESYRYVFVLIESNSIQWKEVVYVYISLRDYIFTLKLLVACAYVRAFREWFQTEIATLVQATESGTITDAMVDTHIRKVQERIDYMDKETNNRQELLSHIDGAKYARIGLVLYRVFITDLLLLFPLERVWAFV